MEINRAGPDELAALPGIGPALAARIVAERQSNGSFTSIEDLSRVPGIGPAISQRIAPFISLEPEPADDVDGSG